MADPDAQRGPLCRTKPAARANVAILCPTNPCDLELRSSQTIAGLARTALRLGEAPGHTTIRCGADRGVRWKNRTLGGNIARQNATIEVLRSTPSATLGSRVKPGRTIAVNEADEFSAELERGVRYEFRKWAEDGTLLGYVYYAPHQASVASLVGGHILSATPS